MGQYYKVYLEDKDQNYRVLNRYVDGQYTMAKLMEHSYWDNPFVSSVCSILYNNPSIIAWVGDYSNEDFYFEKYDHFTPEIYHRVWDGDSGTSIIRNCLDLTDKYLINYSTKEYVDLNEYKSKHSSDSYIISPLPLLTAVGNGLGGGDYGGIHEDDVGMWAFDVIGIADQVDEDFTKIVVDFEDRY